MRSVYKIVIVVICCLSGTESTTTHIGTIRIEQEATSTAQLSFSTEAELSALDTADKERRDDILAVVNNSLSTEGCKKAMLAQLGDGKQCLRDGCATLEHFKDLVTLVGCTNQDYDKLHAVMCVPSDPPCTSASPSPQTTENNEDEKRREEILNVVNNSLSSERCKNIVLIQLGDGKQCLRDGCATLEEYEDIIALVRCTMEDYDKLHAVFCVTSDPPCPSSTLASSTVVGVGTTKAPGISHEQAQKNQIKCTIEKQMSSETCRDVVKSQISENDDLSSSCTKLESLVNTITAVGCTQADYYDLHDVICNWDGTEWCVYHAQTQQDAIRQAENWLSFFCNKSINLNIKSANLSTYCNNLLAHSTQFVSDQLCDPVEMKRLTDSVCCTTVPCLDSNLDNGTRVREVTIVINSLSLTCSQFIKSSQIDLSQPPDLACIAFNTLESAVFGQGICSYQDLSTLRDNVCNSY